MFYCTLLSHTAHCIVELANNVATASGGAGLCANAAACSFVNSTIAGNSATVYGGAIVCEGSTTTCNATNCAVRANEASIGGAAYVEFAALVFANSSVVDNTATAAGSAACLFAGGRVAFSGSVVSGNSGAAAVEVSS